MNVEAVKISTLAAFDLFDAKDLVLQKLDGLTGPGLKDVFEQNAAPCHRLGPRSFGFTIVSALRAAAYSRTASRTKDTRSGAMPREMVRSINSSCC
jgi:hypothetical protein